MTGELQSQKNQHPKRKDGVRGDAIEPVDTAALLVPLQTEIEQLGQLAAATLPDSARKPVPACEGIVLGNWCVM
jgi:hypothetical protein